MMRRMRVKFYLKSSGRSPIEEFLRECSSKLRFDFFDAVNLLTLGQNLSMPLSRNLASIHPGLHELRLKDRSGQIRVFYFIKKGTRFIYCTLLRRKRRSYPER